MVRCLKGAVFDVAVDIRSQSSTFLQWHGEILSAENGRMLYIPEGFAHGFQTLEDDVELVYLHTACYSPHYEGGLRFDDPTLHIAWPLELTDVSEKDRAYPSVDERFAGVVL